MIERSQMHRVRRPPPSETQINAHVLVDFSQGEYISIARYVFTSAEHHGCLAPPIPLAPAPALLSLEVLFIGCHSHYQSFSLTFQ